MTGWPAGEAAARVGVNVWTLRTWDRRYELAPTGRTPGGHRRYTAHDIDRLQRLRRLIEHGVPTAEAAAAVRDERLITPPVPGNAHPRPARRSPLMQSSADRLDLRAAAQAARSALRARGTVAAWTDLFVPALQAAGERWECSGRGVQCEHVLSSAIHFALMAHAASQNSSHTRSDLVLAATGGEAHTLPLDALLTALAEQGIGSCMLGTVPPVALFDTIEQLHPTAAVLWARSSDVADLDELAELSRRVPLVCAAGPGWPGRRRRRGVVITRDLSTTVELAQTWLRSR